MSLIVCQCSYWLWNSQNYHILHLDLALGLCYFSSRLNSFQILMTALENDQCPADPICNKEDKYRSIDGSCNNLQNPKFGQVMAPVQRILKNAYADGYFIPREAKNGKPLPSARIVSTELTSIRTQKNSPINTILLMAVAQFIDHDMTHVPMESKFLISFMPNKAL